MSEQKPFYELPLPKKVKYTVRVAPDLLELSDTAPCAVDGCASNDDDEENVYECDVCGLWFCLDHIYTINNDSICAECGNLTAHVQEQVKAFRREVGR